MKLIENGDALEQVKDMLAGDPIDPGMMFQDPIHNAAPLSDLEESLRKENLRESKKSEASIEEYLKTARNPNFKDYQQSPYYDPSIKSTWFFNRDLKNIMARGGADSSTVKTAISSGARSGSAAAKAVQDDVYYRPPEGTVKAKYLTDIQKKYELDKLDLNSKGTAEEMYDNMRSTIRDILTQESTVRHCLIKTIDQNKFNKLLETPFIGQSAA